MAVIGGRPTDGDSQVGDRVGPGTGRARQTSRTTDDRAAKSRNSPRSQLAIGTANPLFFRWSTSAGSSGRSARLRIVLRVSRAAWKSLGSLATNSRQRAIENGDRASSEFASSRIHLDEEIGGQVARDVGGQHRVHESSGANGANSASSSARRPQDGSETRSARCASM